MNGVPSLWEMNARGQEILLSYLEPEIEAAFVRGWDACLRDLGYLVPDEHAGWALKQIALRPKHADLLDIRGEHAAAERYRALLRERGIA